MSYIQINLENSQPKQSFYLLYFLLFNEKLSKIFQTSFIIILAF